MDDTLVLRDYQYAPSAALVAGMTNKGPRGVLAYYEVGTGKTFADIHGKCGNWTCLRSNYPLQCTINLGCFLGKIYENNQETV